VSKLFFAALCEDVREEKAGKFSLMGLFDRFVVGDFWVVLPTFWFLLESDLTPRAITRLLSNSARFPVPQPAARVNFHSLRFFPEGGAGRLYTSLRWNID
jgi:hypothetical protein